MTTIAYKDGVLAADTRVTQDGIVLPSTSKIVKRDTTSVAICGELSVIQAYRKDQKWDLLSKEVPWEALTCGGYLIDSDGATLTIPDGDFWAIGSGAHFALGAMAAGATPEEAVKIAARYDTGTNDTVEVVTR